MALMITSMITLPLLAAERVTSAADLGTSPNKSVEAFTLDEAPLPAASPVGDTFSLAPLVQDSDFAYFMSSVGAPTAHTFDGAGESGGTNVYGTEGGFFVVVEGIFEVNEDVDRIIVEVWAVDSENAPEPWVDSSHAGTGLLFWRLDIGSTAGGTDPIQPGYPFTVVDSGFNVFNSAAGLIGSFDLSADTSDETGLSGVAVLSNGMSDIAGVDVAGIQMYWDIASGDPDSRIQPLTLTYEETEEEAPDVAQPGVAAITAAEYTQVVLPELRDKALADGSVRLIVGLESEFQPEGNLEASQQQDQRAAIADVGNQLIASLRGMNADIRYQYQTVPFIAVIADAAALDFLASSRLVASISEDRLARPLMASSNPVIGSPVAWAEGLDGSGWSVAVLDTGVDSAHSWFTTGGNKIVSEACYGTNIEAAVESFCPGGAESSTEPGSGLYCDLAIGGCDHGTHVAGTVAGNDATGPNYGVARGADIIAVQVFSKFLTDADCGPGGAPCTLSFSSDQIAGMERVLELSGSMNVASVNMSLGGGSFADQASCDAANPGTKAIIDNLRSAGVATVIAAGNNGFVSRISSPGCISTAISVGATTDGDDVASFSNIYPQIHLLAPGVSIDSSVPGGGIGRKQGTSMATPHVAGAWAVMKQRSPSAGVDAILASLQDTATPVDDLRPGGIETAMPRINLDLAIGEPRTTFGIFNDGNGALSVSSIEAEAPAPWISWSPPAPFDIGPGQVQAVSVEVDYELAPEGYSQSRLLVYSNDPDESPYPGGVFVDVTTLPTTEPEFDSTPPAGATLDFGDQPEGIESAPLLVLVENLGGLDLTLACSITGADATSFVLNECPTPIAGAGSGNISVSCMPESLGAKAATLEVMTNDTDEADVSYALSCTGVEAPPDPVIFSDGFEGP